MLTGWINRELTGTKPPPEKPFEQLEPFKPFERDKQKNE